eukprot:TRINITY_DN15525_c0_g2_i1.p1 TRINITY_DN15525_c0_g2~~TRINITY_DN15525_c0_g2_i1.p1  ORF type:complete len:185 (-),score=35.98 TRINITY_DN15525_c0_g2_i1:138-611(-)
MTEKVLLQGHAVAITELQPKSEVTVLASLEEAAKEKEAHFFCTRLGGTISVDDFCENLMATILEANAVKTAWIAVSCRDPAGDVTLPLYFEQMVTLLSPTRCLRNSSRLVKLGEEVKIIFLFLTSIENLTMAILSRLAFVSLDPTSSWTSKADSIKL